MTQLLLIEPFRAVFYAPYYLALDGGHFARLGVELDLVTAGTPDAAAARLLDGSADRAWSGPMCPMLERSRDPFARIRDHVLLPFAGALEEAHESMLERLTPEMMRSLVALIPDELLASDVTFASPGEYRAAYERWLVHRLEPPHDFLTEALRAHAQLV